MSYERLFLGQGDFAVRDMLAALPPSIPIGLEVISEEFQKRGLPPTEMARFAMDNLRAFVDG